VGSTQAGIECSVVCGFIVCIGSLLCFWTLLVIVRSLGWWVELGWTLSSWFCDVSGSVFGVHGEAVPLLMCQRKCDIV
jgi:hypothetical protein